MSLTWAQIASKRPTVPPQPNKNESKENDILNGKCDQIMRFIMDNPLLKFLVSESRSSIVIYGGLLRFMVSISDQSFEDQKISLFEYFEDGGDIDIFTFTGNIKEIFRGYDILGCEEYISNEQWEHDKQLKKQEIERLSHDVEWYIKSIEHNNHRYLLRHLNKSRFSNFHCKIKSTFSIVEKEVDFSIDLTEIDETRELLYDFDVNCMEYRSGVIMLRSKCPSHAYTNQKKVKVPITLESVVNNIKNKQYLVIGGIHNIHMYRFLKMCQRGFSIVNDQVDILAIKFSKSDKYSFINSENKESKKKLLTQLVMHPNCADFIDSINPEGNPYDMHGYINRKYGEHDSLIKYIMDSIDEEDKQRFLGILSKCKMQNFGPRSSKSILYHINFNDFMEFSKNVKLEFSEYSYSGYSFSIDALEYLKKMYNPCLYICKNMKRITFEWIYNNLSDQDKSQINWNRLLRNAIFENSVDVLDYILSNNKASLLDNNLFEKHSGLMQEYSYEMSTYLFDKVDKNHINDLIYMYVYRFRFHAGIFQMILDTKPCKLVLEWLLNYYVSNYIYDNDKCDMNMILDVIIMNDYYDFAISYLSDNKCKEYESTCGLFIAYLKKMKDKLPTKKDLDLAKTNFDSIINK